MTAARRPARILHLHSTFSLGGKEARAVRLMNLMGDRAEHSILSAMPDMLGARAAIDPAVAVQFPGDAGAPPLHGRPGPARYLALARMMQRFDLVLSYNWGAMDGVMAHRLLSRVMRLPPLIHHEDGFNEDETVRRDWRRSAFRRVALPTARALVVPSRVLAGIAAAEWGAGDRLSLIPNGIDVAAFAGPPNAAIPGLVRQPGEVVIGTVAGLRAVKNLPLLVRLVAALPPHIRLVIVGDGPERAAINAAATSAGLVGERLVMPGFMAHPAQWIGHFDVLALSSHSEQAPICVIEAMAAGLPIASPAVGDVAAMVAAENRPFVAADSAALGAALAALAGDPALRARIGAANRAGAAARFAEAQMVAAYASLYEGAAGRRLFAPEAGTAGH